MITKLKNYFTPAECRSFIRTYIRLKRGAETKVSFTKYGVYYTVNGEERCFSQKTCIHLAYTLANQ